MRTIKFRMWNNVKSDPSKSRMFYDVDEVMVCLEQQMKYDEYPSNAFAYDHVDDGNVFMQFTGLHDKNGKEIYEGDIVEFTTDYNVYDGRGNELKGFKAPVFWSDFRASWAVKMNIHANNDLFRYVRNGGNAVVIGNIHDNPELLEDAK